MTSATILRRIAISLEQDPLVRREPKYLVLRDSILAAIEAGEWSPGEKLPPETAFADEMPVSLGTVQKALKVLAEEGIVDRRHRDGTYVKGTAIQDEISILRFLDKEGESLLPIYTNALIVERTVETGPWTRLMPGEDSYIRIERNVSVDHKFKVHSHIYLPASRFEKLLEPTAYELGGASITNLLGERFNAPMLHTVQHIQVLVLPSPICAVVDVPAGTTGMQLDVQAYSYREQPIALHQIYLPPNDCRLEIREPKR